MFEEKKYNNAFLILLALVIGFFTVILYQTGIFKSFELLTLDYRFMLREKISSVTRGYRGAALKTMPDFAVTKSADSSYRARGIVFIDMPAESADTAGTWLWPRERYASLVKTLSYFGARAIIFDTVFSGSYDELNDYAFAEAMKQSRLVYLPLFYDIDQFAYGISPNGPEYLYMGENVNGVQKPIPILSEYSRGTGHINAFPDIDGNLRRAPALISYKGESTYQLGLKIGYSLLGVEDNDVVFYQERRSISIKLPDGNIQWVSLDDKGQILINWRAHRLNEYPHFLYADIVDASRSENYGGAMPIDVAKLKDMACIVRLAGGSLTDKPAPMAGKYIASGATAMLIDNVLNNDHMRYPSKFLDISVIFFTLMVFIKAATSIRFLRAVMFLFTGLLFYFMILTYGLPKSLNLPLLFFLIGILAVFLASLRFFSGIFLTAVFILCYAMISIALFNLFNLVVVTFYPTFAFLAGYLVICVYHKVVEYLKEIKLLKQATRDPLTSLYNRRHFYICMDMEIDNLKYNKSKKLSIIMCDIDNFKKLNDTYGHQAGDAILKRFAHTMRAKCRQADIVGRYGGEEFIIMLSGAGKTDAANIAEKIRSAIEQEVFIFRNQPYKTTLSIGVAEYTNERTKEELIEKADQALYKAKQEGKNRVWVHSDKK